MKKYFVIISIIYLIPVISLFAMGNKKEMIPAGIKKPSIINMEYQKYAHFVGNEITEYVYFIYCLSNNGKTLVLFVGSDSRNETNIPLKLKDFSDRFTFDMNTGNTLDFIQNWSNSMFSKKEKGIFFIETTFDYIGHQADSKILSWNGFEIKTQKSRIQLKTGYTYFCGTEVFPAILRFLDPNKPGVVYLAVPGFLNAAFPGSFRVKGKEEITTLFGKFNALKINFTLADPFMARLIKGYTDSFMMWVDPDTGATLKIQFTETSLFELVETGIWEDK